MPNPQSFGRHMRQTRMPLHPLQAVLLAFPVALFPTALLTDIAYLETADIQWSNFSAWLITAALMIGAFALLWALIAALRKGPSQSQRRYRLHALLLALAWLAGLINAFQHSHDGWASVGTFGLVLSVISAVLALAAGWIAYSGVRIETMETAP